MSTIRRFAKKLVKEIRFYLRYPRYVKSIKKVIELPTYYPEFERKTHKEMMQDNIRWLFKNREVNKLYTGYGLDVKNFRNPEDFITHKDFCNQRDAGIVSKRAFYGHPYNEVILVRDKYVFSAYIEATLGENVIPKTIGLLEGGEVFLHQDKKWVSVEEFCGQDFRYVFKVVDGTFGDGVRMVTNSDGMLHYGGTTHNVEQMIQDYSGRRVLIQDLIVQHKALQAFQTSCVNTIRAITIRGRKTGKIELFAAFLRVGNDTDSFVDNRAKGGLAVGVEPETGKLMKYGFPHEEFGTKVAVHPLSGITFEGYQLPYWKEAVEMIISAHRQFPDIATIGWDVTMTETGPVIVEANDGWEISGPQDTYGGLKERWNRLLAQ